MTFLPFIRMFFIIARASGKQIGVDVLSRLSFSCHLPSPAGRSGRFPPINGFCGHLNEDVDGCVCHSVAGGEIASDVPAQLLLWRGYNVRGRKSDGPSRIRCHSRLKCGRGGFTLRRIGRAAAAAAAAAAPRKRAHNLEALTSKGGGSSLVNGEAPIPRV